MLNISNNKVGPAIEQHYKIHSLDTLHTPRSSKVLTYWLLGIGAVFLVVLFMPWQQNITGTGTLTALTPQDRPQNVQNAIAGQVQQWYVQEGQYVRKGDTLLRISEVKDDYFDPNLLLRTREQVQAQEDYLVATRQKIAALNDQIRALRDNLKFSLEKGRNKVKQGQLKVISDSTDIIAKQADFRVAAAQQERIEQGYREGLFSLTELERRRLKFQEEQAKLVSTQNKLLISRQELLNARIELSSLNAEYADKIAKAQSDLGSAQGSLAEGDSKLSQLRNKYENLRIRNGRYAVQAPQDGWIVRALKAGIGETIKEGESVVTMQPGQPQTAVELYVRAMDVPLLTKGRKTRLQFDGWPAIQFSGWPGVSVGTFGGVVRVIDMVDSKQGKYRILVTPDPDDAPWPVQLRLGSGAYGWVMLNDVPVWFELWRQLNGFPPNLLDQPSGTDPKTDNKQAAK